MIFPTREPLVERLLVQRRSPYITTTGLIRKSVRTSTYTHTLWKALHVLCF